MKLFIKDAFGTKVELTRDLEDQEYVGFILNGLKESINGTEDPLVVLENSNPAYWYALVREGDGSYKPLPLATQGVKVKVLEYYSN